jgi:hypothetical protein
MAYVINRSDGTAIVTLEDATVDNSTSLTLVGRNYIGYGEIQNENFLFLLENFSNDSAPSRPISGQAWFDRNTNTLKAYDGDKWVEVGAAALSDTPPPAPPIGAFWFKTPIGTLHVWNGVQWVFIGPEAAEGAGITRAQSTTILSDSNIRYPVIKVYVNAVLTGIIAAAPFTISTGDPQPGFTSIRAGYNMAAGFELTGDVEGTAARADRLAHPRLINGVSFDAGSDITITASTTKNLRAGDYLVGNDFNGSVVETWDVDATANNTIGKVVARDSSGDFSAGTITADLIGDVQGNVNTSTGISQFNEVHASKFVGAILTGNANSATRLATPRNINGVAFDGTTDVTVSADANTLTGTNLHNTVVTSNLQSVGNLVNLDVIGDIVVNSDLTLSATTDAEIYANRVLKLGANDSADSATLKIISPDAAVTDGIGPRGALMPETNLDVDLGKSTHKFNNVYANTFIGDLNGNASTATSATTSVNITGGAAGAIPYQSATGTTQFVPSGVAGYVLRSGGAGAPVWGALTFATLNVGNYLTGSNYDGVLATTLNVDADSANTANKIVARDANGDFAAGQITANLVGNVTGNTVGTHTGNVVGNVTGNVVGNLTGTATNATNAFYSTTQPLATSNTTVATTEFVQQAINASRPRTMTVSGPAPNTTSPDSQYIDLIQAYIPANTVSSGTTFELIINYVYAGTSSSFSASRWIQAYRWGTASISSTTTIYQSGTGYKLRYSSNGSNWSYTGIWSYV